MAKVSAGWLMLMARGRNGSYAVPTTLVETACHAGEKRIQTKAGSAQEISGIFLDVGLKACCEICF